MKRIIILGIGLIVMLVSVSGCWMGWDTERGGRGGGYDREEGLDRDQWHQEVR